MARILIIDDEPDIVGLLESLLKGRGHEILTGSDGEQALAIARSELPDLLLLDLSLPKVDGFEVCKQLKADEKTRHIPILMMTAAYDTVEDAERGMKSGADEFVSKPFLSQVMLHNIERLLSKE